MLDGRVWSPVAEVPLQPGGATFPSKCLHWKYDCKGALHSRRHPKTPRNADLSKHLSSAIPGNPAVLMLSLAKSPARHSVTYMCMAQSAMGGGRNERETQAMVCQPISPRVLRAHGCAGTAVSCRAPRGLQGTCRAREPRVSLAVMVPASLCDAGCIQ